MSKKSSKSKSPGSSSAQRPSIPSSRAKDGKTPATSGPETPPLCACGCGEPTKWSERLGRWGVFLRFHNLGAARARVDLAKRSAAASKTSRARMLTHNPMKDPEVARRVSIKMRGRTVNRSPEGARNIAEAARRRMLSDANPMKNEAVHRAALVKTMSRSEPSKNELHFMRWLEQQELDLEFTGLGGIWIGRRNPDFRVPGQRKVVEVTQRECFTDRRRPRTIEEYGTVTAKHYLSKGWQVLVVWKRDHRCAIPDTLAPVIARFVSPASIWSGAWHYDRLLAFDGFRGEFASTT